MNFPRLPDSDEIIVKDLSRKQEQVILALGVKRGQTKYDLAKELNVRYSHIQQIVGRLHSIHYITIDKEATYSRTGLKKQNYRLTSKGIRHFIAISKETTESYRLHSFFESYVELYPLFRKWTDLLVAGLNEEAIAGYMRALYFTQRSTLHPVDDKREWTLEFILGGLFHIPRNSTPSSQPKDSHSSILTVYDQDVFLGMLQDYWYQIHPDTDPKNALQKRERYYDFAIMELLFLMRLDREVNQRWLEYIQRDPELLAPFSEALNLLTTRVNDISDNWNKFINLFGLK